MSGPAERKERRHRSLALDHHSAAVGEPAAIAEQDAGGGGDVNPRRFAVGFHTARGSARY